VPVRRVNTEDAEAAARNAYLLRAQARLGAYVDAGRAAKRAATAHVGAGPATSLGPRSYVEEYERSINQLSRRTGRRMSAWS